MVAAEQVGTVSVFLNNRDRTFAAGVRYDGGGGGLTCVFAADLDLDGDNDLVTTGNYENYVSVLLNNGDGTFTAVVHYKGGDDPSSVFAADLDGDGDNDLAVTNWGSDDVSILWNTTRK